jgi:excisionase family DNA binding protein
MRAGDPPFLTVTEVAARLRVSKMTIYRLVHAGELHALRIGDSLRIPASALIRKSN